MLRSEIIYYINFKPLESVALSGNSNEDDIYLRFFTYNLGKRGITYQPSTVRLLLI